MFTRAARNTTAFITRALSEPHNIGSAFEAGVTGAIKGAFTGAGIGAVGGGMGAGIYTYSSTLKESLAKEEPIIEAHVKSLKTGAEAAASGVLVGGASGIFPGAVLGAGPKTALLTGLVGIVGLYNTSSKKISSEDADDSLSSASRPKSEETNRPKA